MGVSPVRFPSVACFESMSQAAACMLRQMHRNSLSPHLFSTGHQLQDMKVDDLVRSHVPYIHNNLLRSGQDSQRCIAHLALLLP